MWPVSRASWREPPALSIEQQQVRRRAREGDVTLSRRCCQRLGRRCVKGFVARQVSSAQLVTHATPRSYSRRVNVLVIDRIGIVGELTFDVAATDVGYSGTLRLRFIHDRLATAVFIPTDFPACVDDLRRGGTTLRSCQAPAARVNVRRRPSN